MLRTLSAGLCCACVVQLVGSEGGLEEQVDHAEHACHTHQEGDAKNEAQGTGRTKKWRNGRMAEWQNGRMVGWQGGRVSGWQGVRVAEEDTVHRSADLPGGERATEKEGERNFNSLTCTIMQVPSTKYKVQSNK